MQSLLGTAKALLSAAKNPAAPAVQAAPGEPAEPEPASPAPDPYDISVDRMRATTKWALAALAAIGTLLVAGSQLSSIGQFDIAWIDGEGERLTVAFGAIAISLVVVGLAVWSVIEVDAAGEVSLADIARKGSRNRALDQAYLAANPSLLGGYGSVDDLHSAYKTAISDRYKAIQVLTQTAPKTEMKAADRRALNQAQQRIDYLGNVLIAPLLSNLRYRRVAQAFDRSVRRMAIAGIAGGFTVVVFVWAANPETPDAEAPAFQTPVQAEVSVLTDTENDRLINLHGESCIAPPKEAPLPVFVLSSNDQEADVVSVPPGNRPECQPVRFTVALESVKRIVPALLATPES